MSAGAFTRAFYTTDLGVKVPIRVQPETLELMVGATVNASASAPAAAGYPSATVSRSRRGIGIHPRTVTVQFTGAVPSGYKAGSTYTIPVLSKTVWDAASIGGAGDYLNNEVEIVSTNPEKIR